MALALLGERGSYLDAIPLRVQRAHEEAEQVRLLVDEGHLVDGVRFVQPSEQVLKDEARVGLRERVSFQVKELVGDFDLPPLRVSPLTLS